ncbi:MAG TPA: TlyA family RNA methyltransferase [Polyangiaceae bacterium]|nr:TlyA family RNA methyltransferase [Polyangiaceae bacterium]
MTPRSRRTRIDVLLVERGLAPTRAKAQALILAGAVSSGSERIDKAGTLVDPTIALEVAGDKNRFVSRGGEKLEHALVYFAAEGLDVAGAVAVDVGASTGGFTDCLLSRGVHKVYAVDVGYGQLAYPLRNDPRVVVRERTNAKSVTRESFAEPIDLVVVDASFIGLGKLMPAIASVLRPHGNLVALVKPQFEAGRDAARSGHGVIRDPVVRAGAIDGARSAVVATGFSIEREIDSAVPGPKGNVEHFLWAKRNA